MVIRTSILMMSCLVFSRAYAKQVTLAVDATPAAIEVTYEVHYLLHWSDGTSTNGVMNSDAFKKGQQELEVKDGGPAIVGCDATFVFAPTVSNESTILPRDLNPLGNKSVACRKDSDSKFSLIPQFSVRTLDIVIDPSFFDSTKAYMLLTSPNVVGSNAYFLPRVPPAKPSTTPTIYKFRVVSDGRIKLSAKLKWFIHGSPSGNAEIAENDNGEIIVH